MMMTRVTEPGVFRVKTPSQIGFKLGDEFKNLHSHAFHKLTQNLKTVFIFLVPELAERQ